MPSVINTTVINANNTTIGNNGRKIVMLDDGTFVSTDKVDGGAIYVRKSVDNGNTWQQIASVSTGQVNCTALETDGVRVFFLYKMGIGSLLMSVINPATQQNVDLVATNQYINVDNAGSSGEVPALAINSKKTELTAAWISKDATYTECPNIKTAKFTIGVDGNVTMTKHNGTAGFDRVTTLNNASYSFNGISVVYDKNDNPVLLFCAEGIYWSTENGGNTSTSYKAVSRVLIKAGSFYLKTAYLCSGAYTQYHTSSCVDEDGVIHVTWHGKDSVNTLHDNIFYMKSTDDGLNWSVPEKLTSGSVIHQNEACISVTKGKKIFILFYAYDLAINTTAYQIRLITNDGSGWTTKSLTANTTGDACFPSALQNLRINCVEPIFIYNDKQTSSVKFYGKWITTQITDKTYPTVEATLSNTDGLVVDTIKLVINELLVESKPSGNVNNFTIAGDKVLKTNNTVTFEFWGAGEKQAIERFTMVSPLYKNSVVIQKQYETGTNEGRKITRLANGWIVAFMADNSLQFSYFMVSKDEGKTFTQLAYINKAPTSYGVPYLALCSKGNMVYAIQTQATYTNVLFYAFDATTVNNTDAIPAASIDESQTSFQGCSIAINSTGDKLHACWSSKNSTYSAAFNVRYIEGTINANGTITWSSVEQLTLGNSTAYYFTYPCIIILNNKPLILVSSSSRWATATTNGAEDTIIIMAKNRNLFYTGSIISTLWSSSVVNTTGAVNSYTQSKPSACVDNNGVIHVAWQGIDGTDSTYNNIKYSKSADGGLNWSTLEKLTTGNTQHQQDPSITVNKKNEIFIVWAGGIPNSSTVLNIRKIKYSNNAWSSIENVTTFLSGGWCFNAATLCDPTTDFVEPIYIYLDNQALAIKFTGSFVTTSLNILNKLFPSLNWSITSNFTLSGARIKINGILKQSYVSASEALQYNIDIKDLPFDANIITIEIDDIIGGTHTKTLRALRTPKSPYEPNESLITLKAALSIVGSTDTEEFTNMNKKLAPVTTSLGEAQFDGYGEPNSKITQRIEITRTRMTLENLLGSAGDCENTADWYSFQATKQLEPSIKMFGSNSIKGTITAGTGYIIHKTKEVLGLDPTKYYCCSAYLLNGNLSTGMQIRVEGPNKRSDWVTDTKNFNRVFIKLSPAEITSMTNVQPIAIAGVGVNEQYGYVDGVMINEISQEDYENNNYQPFEYINGVKELSAVITRLAGAIG